MDALLGFFGLSLERSGSFLGVSWRHLGTSWRGVLGYLGQSLKALGRFRCVLETFRVASERQLHGHWKRLRKRAKSTGKSGCDAACVFIGFRRYASLARSPGQFALFHFACSCLCFAALRLSSQRQPGDSTLIAYMFEICVMVCVCGFMLEVFMHGVGKRL